MLPGQEDYESQTASARADKRPQVILKATLRQIAVKLDNALNEFELRVPGDFLYADENTTGNATIKLNNTSENVIPLKVGSSVENIPIEFAYLSCPAQPGLVLNLWYGYRGRIRPSQAVIVKFPCDRTPLGKAFQSGTLNNIGAHASTDRFSYTVPALRKFQVGNAEIHLIGVTATAALVGPIQSTIIYTPSGGGGAFALTANVIRLSVAEVIALTGMQGMVAFAGDQFKGNDVDGSTGTTADYWQSLVGFEFDA